MAWKFDLVPYSFNIKITVKIHQNKNLFQKSKKGIYSGFENSKTLFPLSLSHLSFFLSSLFSLLSFFSLSLYSIPSSLSLGPATTRPNLASHRPDEPPPA